MSVTFCFKAQLKCFIFAFLFQKCFAECKVLKKFQTKLQRQGKQSIFSLFGPLVGAIVVCLAKHQHSRWEYTNICVNYDHYPKRFPLLTAKHSEYVLLFHSSLLPFKEFPLGVSQTWCRCVKLWRATAHVWRRLQQKSVCWFQSRKPADRSLAFCHRSQNRLFAAAAAGKQLQWFVW